MDNVSNVEKVGVGGASQPDGDLMLRTCKCRCRSLHYSKINFLKRYLT